MGWAPTGMGGAHRSAMDGSKPQPWRPCLHSLFMRLSWAPVWAAALLLLAAGLAGGSTACPASPDTAQLPNATSSGYLEIGDASRLFYLYYEAAGAGASSSGILGQAKDVPITLWLQVRPVRGAAAINGEPATHPPCFRRAAAAAAASSTRRYCRRPCFRAALAAPRCLVHSTSWGRSW